MAVNHRTTHSEAVRKPAGSERETRHREIERGKEKADLRAGKAEFVFVKRRQRVDRILRHRADNMRSGDDAEDHPARIGALRIHRGNSESTVWRVSRTR